MSLLQRARLLGLGILFGQLCGCGPESQNAGGSGFVQVKDGGFVDEHGNGLVLESMTFQNWIGGPAQPLATHHDERDYERVAAMGLNSIQFMMSYRWFEDDESPFSYKSSGFEWLDQNLQWAKAHGLRMILTMAEPQGGPQGGPYWDCERKAALWENAENQERLISLWGAIGERYSGETSIAAYNLLGIASPTESSGQWQELATRIITRIRQSGDQHVAIVGEAEFVGCEFEEKVSDRRVLVPVSNVAYGFRYITPWRFTAQLLAQSGLGEGGRYPDDSHLVIDDEHISWDDDWLGWTLDSTPGPETLRLKPEESEWTEKRFAYTVTDADYDFASLVFGSTNNSGTACIDAIVVNEYRGTFGEMSLLRTVFDIDPELGTDWYLWQDPDGNATGMITTEQDSVRGSASVCVSGTSSAANISAALYFPATLGHTIEVKYWVKGRDIDREAQALMKLEFWRYNTELQFRNRDYLEQSLGEHRTWSDEHGVPLYAYELGTGNPTFANDKGGLEWARDVLEIAHRDRLSFSYNNYHGEAYGLYRGDTGLPDPENANQPLIDLFTDTLH